MPDSFYFEFRNNAGPAIPPDAMNKVRLLDNGDGTFSIAAAVVPNGYLNIAGAATTLVKAGAGVLRRLVLNRPVALGVVTLYDSLTATGTKIATLTNPAALLQQQVCLDFDLAFATGLTVKTTAADDLTVVYR